jgi:hypothetical protein
MPPMRKERVPRGSRFFCMEKESSKQYREFAEECERLAPQTTNEHHRKLLKEMAGAWRKLADAAESGS